jgi:hypothetical protein
MWSMQIFSFEPWSMIPLVRVCIRSALAHCNHELALHQTQVHRGPQKTNKVSGLTNLKDYGEGCPYFYMLCSSTINFHCGTKPNKLCHHTSLNFDGFMIRFEGLRKKYWIFSVWWRYSSKTRTYISTLYFFYSCSCEKIADHLLTGDNKQKLWQI